MHLRQILVSGIKQRRSPVRARGPGLWKTLCGGRRRRGRGFTPV